MRINTVDELEEAITLLKARQAEQKMVLVDHFHDTYESMRPVNIIKNAFRKVTETPELGSKLVGATMGVGAGMLSKKILVGKPTNIFKRLLGLVVEVAVANTVAKNSDGIKRRGSQLINKLIK